MLRKNQVWQNLKPCSRIQSSPPSRFFLLILYA